MIPSVSVGEVKGLKYRSVDFRHDQTNVSLPAVPT